MDTQAVAIEKAGAMPAATWHFLNMNDACIEIPAGLAIAPNVNVSVPEHARGAGESFDAALAAAQRAWEQAHPAPTPEEAAERAAYVAAEADATYGGTAQSTYQANADAIEDARSLAAAFAHGLGDEAACFLRDAAGSRVVVASSEGACADAQVVVAAEPGVASCAAVDVVAAPNSVANVSIVVSGPCEPGTGEVGVAGTTVRVFAGEGARVNVTRMQALGEGFADMDDMGLFASDGAQISVRQTVLGAAESFAGLGGDLRGDASCIDVDTRYLAHGSQKRDFNYSLRHHGKKTACNLDASGVLAGTSSKTLRGTIDLIRGCKGSEGSEHETVLLVDEGVHNKTVPVILCNEDDVAGNHGATIGHIRDEQMFYLASRGLSREEAERLFVSSVLEQAVVDAVDDAARDAALALGEHLSPGFTELFEGDE